jgi:hypothetical protein
VVPREPRASARPTAPVGTKAVKPYGTSAPADPQRGQTNKAACPRSRAARTRGAARVVASPARARPPVRARCAHTHHHRSRITDHASPKAVSSAHDHEPRTTRSTIPCDPARCTCSGLQSRGLREGKQYVSTKKTCSAGCFTHTAHTVSREEDRQSAVTALTHAARHGQPPHRCLPLAAPCGSPSWVHAVLSS